MRYLICLMLLGLSVCFMGCVQEKVSGPYRPGMVVILRHGEKPDPEGVDLSERGRQRAQALVNVFKERPELNVNGKPVVIYAMLPGGNDDSRRPMQTVEPTSKALGIPMVTTYTHLEYEQMVKAIFENPAYVGKTVVVCWEHHVIPDMARAFGVKKPPGKWHGDVFDRFWVITYPGGEARMIVAPELALPGDGN
jgi:hypothetical protein